MAAMSDYLEAAILNETLRNTNLAAIATPYVALYTASPTDADSGTEVVTAGPSAYTRQAATFGAPSGGASTTTADITFPVATADWGTVTHIGIRDAATGSAGNLLYWGQLDTPKTISTGDQFKILAGNLTVTLD